MTTKLKNLKKQLGALTYQDVAEILCEEWIMKLTEEESFSDEVLAQKIQDAYRRHSKLEKEINYGAASNLLSKIRVYLELTYKKTIITCGRYKWKVANPKEATSAAVGAYAGYLRGAEKVLRRIPLVRQQYLPGAVRKAFLGADKRLLDFARSNEPLRLSVEEFKNSERETKKVTNGKD